ncbi:MAG TPA: hypothetical protein VMU86_01830, partial [Steroidobacteraceae bacterium]|nr:hypothetical protein [Steroidobacteraceae bacterium]
MHKPTINGRLAICLAACVAGATLAAPIALGAPSRSASAAAATPAGTAASGAPATAAAAAMPAPMTAQQVIALLERTIQWYRDQRSERDIATQPDDWPILSQDARIAQQVVSSTFDIARADAAMIALTGSPEAAVAGGAATAGVFQLKTRLTADRKSIDAETAQVRAQLARARGARRATLTAQISELRGERDLADARLGIIDSMAEFVGTGGAGTNSLKMQIEAMATGLPGSVTHARGGSRSAPA